MTMTSVPPTAFTALMCSRTHASPRRTDPSPPATSRNGTPSPSEYASRRTAPEARSLFRRMVRMSARYGPMHGVQPAPKAMPMSSERR